MANDVPDDPLTMLLEEIQQGKGVSLAAAVRPLPAHRGSGRVNAATAYRWGTKGVKLPDGRVVKLAVARCGGRFLTTREAVSRFLRETTTAVCPQGAPALRSPAARTRASRAAEQELVRRGA